MIVFSGDGVDMGAGHVAVVSMGVHELVHVARNELCRVRFEGGKTVAEFNGWAVEGGVWKIAYRGDSEAEHPADLTFEDVELRVAKEAELEDDVFANEKSPGDADSTRLRQEGSR
jgi:hypothetical protein